MWKRKYDYIVYKTTDLVNGKIYIGYDSYNRPKYFGSGTYFLNSLNKRIKNYIENDLNEIYDGSDKNKLRQYRQKYANIFLKKEIIEHFENKEDMLKGEIKWISHFKSQDKSIGYNISPGGDTSGSGFNNNPNKDIIRQRCVDSKRHIMKSVYQYYLNGIIFKKYESINQASKETGFLVGEICRACNGHYKKYKGYIWLFEYIDNPITVKEYSKTCKDPIIIYQYDLDNNLIEEHKSITNAMKITGIGTRNINKCLKHKKMSVGGYIWRYERL